ncbi:hypothetical protein ABW21_db0203920 [Orbilia brochopaga]|nr:hypothetical protein ABW21_db0203920 [Drechslerella brochopaga]
MKKARRNSCGSAADALVAHGRNSHLSGHFRECMVGIGIHQIICLVTLIYPRAARFEIVRRMGDMLANYIMYRFDTRGDAPDDDFDFEEHPEFLQYIASYNRRKPGEAAIRGVDWGPSRIHVFRCHDAAVAEWMFKRWLIALFPFSTPQPVSGRYGIGHSSLQHTLGRVYWIRDNIFMKLDIDDKTKAPRSVKRLAQLIDRFLVTNSKRLLYNTLEPYPDPDFYNDAGIWLEIR